MCINLHVSVYINICSVCQALSLWNIPVQPTASVATTTCCSPLNNYKHSPNANLTTNHEYFHRPAKGAAQRGCKGKIMNMMMTHLIKYHLQQKRDMWAHREKKGKGRGRSKLRYDGSSGWIKSYCLLGITGKYFTIAWTSDTVPLICKVKTMPLNPNKKSQVQIGTSNNLANNFLRSL